MTVRGARPWAGPGRYPGGQRIGPGHVEWVSERLSARDWAIIEMVNRLRLLRADQLERLFFWNLSSRSQYVSRGRVLHRLVAWQVLAMLPRRVGGAPRGSAGAVYVLGVVGQRLLLARSRAAGQIPRVRHPGAPGERSLAHILAVSELCTRLAELTRTQAAGLVTFEAEPACWWPNGLGGWLKPDAYLALDSGTVRDHWWIEVDRATESLPTLQRKLLTYLEFVGRGQLGPDHLMPRVLITVPGEPRLAAVRVALGRLPDPAGQLFHVATEPLAPTYLLQLLYK